MYQETTDSLSHLQARPPAASGHQRGRPAFPHAPCATDESTLGLWNPTRVHTCNDWCGARDLHRLRRNRRRARRPGDAVQLAEQQRERVSIKRHEDGCTATGTEYHRYRVRVDRPAAAAPDFDKFTRADDIPPADVRQAIEETREAVESKPVAEPASRTESFADFPEALGDDPDDDLPF